MGPAMPIGRRIQRRCPLVVPSADPIRAVAMGNILPWLRIGGPIVSCICEH
jgi:hypothetical protein